MSDSRSGETPRTDAKDASLRGNFAMCYGVMLEFARSIERELSCSNRRIVQLETIHVASDAEHARDVERLTKERDYARECLRDCIDMMARGDLVTGQWRDVVTNQTIDRWRKAAEME